MYLYRYDFVIETITVNKHIYIYFASSKAMEAEVGVELWNQGENQDLQYIRFVGDDDSSMIKNIRDTVDFDVENWSDIAHAKRALGNRLYTLKGKGHKELS